MILKFTRSGKGPYILDKSYDQMSDIGDDKLMLKQFFHKSNSDPSYWYATRRMSIGFDSKGDPTFGKGSKKDNIDIVYIDEDRISEVNSKEALEAWEDYRDSKIDGILNLPE